MSDRLDVAKAALSGWRRAEDDRLRERMPTLLDESDDWRNPNSASKEWTADAIEAVRHAALGTEYLTVDSVVWPEDPSVDPRARGAVMIQAMRAGTVAKTDSYVGGGAARHGRPLRIFQSKLIRGGMA